MTIEAKDVAYLDGKKVSVTVAGTNYYRNQLVLQARTSKTILYWCHSLSVDQS